MTKLLIEVQQARLYRDCDTFGKMDPYVVLESGSTKVQTNAHKGGGKNPSWNQTLGINVNTDTVTVTVLDEDPGDDDIVGYGTIDVNTVKASGTYQDWIRIYHKGVEAGEVYIVASVDATATLTTATYATTMPTYTAAPTVYAPAPTVYAPAPTYAAYAPAPVYAAAPGYAPAPVYGATYAAMPTVAPAPAPVYYSTSPGVYTTVPAPAPCQIMIMYNNQNTKHIFIKYKNRV